jgi:hypothetical protein
LTLRHDPADAGGSAGDALIGQIIADPPIAVTAAVMSEDSFDFRTDLLVGRLGGRGFGCVVIAASRDAEGGADEADAVAGGLVDFADHFSKPGWGLVPRMTAAFFKISFSALRRASSRRRVRRSSAADGPRALRLAFPSVEKVAADAQFLGDLGNRSAGVGELDGVGFELGGVALSWLGFH